MYTHSFDYYRARSVADAQRLLAAHPGARLLSGGHSLLPLLKLRLAAPAALVDIGRIARLKRVRRGKGVLRIGALATHADLASSPLVRRACPVLAEAASRIGDAAVRNRGTIGGSLAHADPGGDLATVLTALGASVEITGPGGDARVVPVSGFITGLMATVLGDRDVVTSVEVPARAAGQGAAYVKLPHPASRYAVIGVAASVTVRDGVVSAASVVAGGLVPRPTRLPSVEAALIGGTAADAPSAAERTAGDLGAEVMGDIFASADYRRSVAAVYVAQALAAAFQRTRR